MEAKTEDEVERILQSVSNGKNRETRGWNRFWAEKSELGEWNANFVKEMRILGVNLLKPPFYRQSGS